MPSAFLYGQSATELGSFSPNDAIYPAANPAAANSRNEHPIIAFDDTTDEFVIFGGVLGQYGSSGLFVDVYWVAATAVAGDVVWSAEWERIAEGGQDIDADGFAAAQTATSTTDGTAGSVTITSIEFTQAQADAIEARDAYRLRISRDANSGDDDMVGDAQILRVAVRQ